MPDTIRPHTPAPPAVSILMTVWNGEAYLHEAIDSVFAQHTSAPWELIVVDDGSTDRSAAIVREYIARAAHHPGRTNCGISASRNLALHSARAPVVAFLDCDDVFLPHHLHSQLDLLRRHPAAVLVYAAAERWVDPMLPFDRAAAEGAWWGTNYLPPLVPHGDTPGILQPGTLLRWMLAGESFAPCMCTVLVRTAAALAVHGFEDEFHGLYDDQVFHAKLSSRFAVYANPDCTARYRQHATSCCATATGNPTARDHHAAHFRAWVQQYAQREEEAF